MGSDLSFANQVQDYGGVYKDSGAVQDPFTIFKKHGNNVVRVRLWNNPQWLAQYNNGHLYSDINDVAKTIQRAKAAGMAVNLDLHYSDTWADPNNQNIPAAWVGLPLATLVDSVYNYTLYVLNYFKSKNLAPEMIQIGNETNQGMLWPTGKVVNNNFTAFAQLLNSGIKAVRDFSATSTIKPLIILHVAQIQNADWYANGVIQAGASDFDILGISHYADYTTLTSMSQVSTNISSLKNKYNKQIMLAEASYPWTLLNADTYPNINNDSFPGYTVSQQAQYQYMRDLTQQVILGGGTGVMYWAPDWISTSMKDQWGTGSSWDNNTFFDFNGNTLPSIDYMTYKYNF
jgi:arabinogalactan endo-1,4-beta-galactosidase